jgi:outer membrane protein assembly factor BamB
MWRADAGRTAFTPAALPDRLRLAWVRDLPPQDPAWDDEGGMRFDRGYEPVILGGRLFVGSTVNDTVTAYDLATGAERWRFYTGGPVRVAPAAWRDLVFAASDDGYLYALDAATGRPRWKFCGGPSGRRLIGNERLISTWPARGGPVVADGTVYFAAGVWPFMGTFVHALRAETGQVVWTNDSTSFSWRRFPHPGSWAMSGLSPQGHLAIVGDRLVVPGSRYKPAVFDLRTGEFVCYGEATSPTVAGQGRFGFAGGQPFDVATGWPVRLEGLGRMDLPVLAPGRWYTSGAVVEAAGVEVAESSIQVPETTSPDGPTYTQPIFAGTVVRQAGPRGRPRLLAGSRLVVDAKGGLQVLDVSGAGPVFPVVAEVSVAGPVTAVLAGGGHLVVVTADGKVRCFGPAEGEAVTHPLPPPAPLAETPWRDRAARFLKAAGSPDGYALVLGLKDGGLVEELVRQSNLHVIAIGADAAKVEALRRRLDAAGLYGRRAAAIIADPMKLQVAPYLASLIASEDAEAAGSGQGAAFINHLFAMLRPYGGALCLERPAGGAAAIEKMVQDAGCTAAKVRAEGDLVLVTREGPLPGSAGWFGQNADAGNTRFSRDRLVKPPLGVLWFGNALSNSLILPRHGEGPVEQVAGGRLVIEGPDSLSAADVYTGRLLWTRTFEGLGKYYNIPKHQRGAHALGGNFYAVPDAVYVAHGPSCHVLDPATGGTRREFRLPGGSEWMFLLVYEDLLIAGADPIVTPSPSGRYNASASSRGLVVMDRSSGRVLWQRRADQSFGHYAVVAGRGKVFCVDRPAPEEVEFLKRRGLEPAGGQSLLALDARTGKLLWQSDRCVSQALSYSEEHDILVAGGALRGRDGAVLWDRLKTVGYEKHPNPGLDSSADPLWWGKWGPMIGPGTIYTQGQRAFGLLDGQQKTWTDPDGQAREWRFRRFHGCGPSAGAHHILTFRSGTAGFYDLARDGGTGNLGAFRSGCTSNLIVADGVLNAPDYTRTCTCPYENRASLAFVHMPEVEYWTFGALPAPGRVGVNFGAPGDRRDDAGTLWCDWPSVGGPSHGAAVRTAPEKPRSFCHHVSRIQGGEGAPWVAASGVEGARQVAVEVGRGGSGGRWTVRLVFAEVACGDPGERVFNVRLQGRPVLEHFDVAKEAGGPWRGVVREFRGVEAADGVLTIDLAAERGETLLSGVEAAAE